MTEPITEPPARGPSGPDVLICAGLDPSGGAGLIADVRVVSLLGGRPVGVVTALTVQNTTAVVAFDSLDATMVREQLEFLLSDVEVRAIKIGMIGSSGVAEAIGEALALTDAPVVWDPVIQPSRGEVPFVDRQFGRAIAALGPHLTVVTPNAMELSFLTGHSVESMTDAVAAGRALSGQLATAVLVKGGHLGGDEAVDVLCHAFGHEMLRGPRLPRGEHVHGTGCALSSALATHLALGAELMDACRAAKDFVASRLASPIRPGRGASSLL